ncbi:MAG: histidine phosphatase family protein [Minisyncoccia bacterium]
MAPLSQIAIGIREALLANIAPYPLVAPLWEVLAGVLVFIIIGTEIFRALHTKYFFFVRHGETLLNAQNIRQSEKGGLSPRGVAQAESTARFLAHFGIRLILASPYERTRQTAEILQKHLHCPVRYLRILVERRNPFEIIGKSADDPAIKRVIDLMDLSFHDDTYRYSDEENFVELKKRAAAALLQLARRGRGRTAVVTA